MQEQHPDEAEDFGDFRLPGRADHEAGPARELTPDGQEYFNQPPVQLHWGGSYFMVDGQSPTVGEPEEVQLSDSPREPVPTRSSTWTPSLSDIAGLTFLVSQLVFFLCAAFIFLNAVAQSVLDGDWFVFTVEVIFAPFVPVVYPWVASPGVVAWPFASSSYLVYAWLLGAVAFGLSWLIEWIDL